jgi:hypothetical protein
MAIEILKSRDSIPAADKPAGPYTTIFIREPDAANHKLAHVDGDSIINEKKR